MRLPVSACIVDRRCGKPKANGKHLGNALYAISKTIPKREISVIRWPRDLVGRAGVLAKTHAAFILPPQPSILSFHTPSNASGTTLGASCIPIPFNPDFSLSSVIRQKNRAFGSAEWPVRSNGRSVVGREEMMFTHFGVEMHDGRSVSSSVTPCEASERGKC
jgi:hypothetical protein